jgi:hypothetical protein
LGHHTFHRITLSASLYQTQFEISRHDAFL